ncbi:butyrophilin subfamily 2 member A2-like isoform X3 [Scomber scombrus]|uniref:Butyrophilin subfamily 2 member A2-like isoform X3 n=1 Tax=Scomber scombrus TaxID=13677 RepID=A0AAV1QHU5_SCOSC
MDTEASLTSGLVFPETKRSCRDETDGGGNKKDSKSDYPERQPLNAAGTDGETLTWEEKQAELLQEKQNREKAEKEVKDLKDLLESKQKQLEKQNREEEVKDLKDHPESKQKQVNVIIMKCLNEDG